MDYLLPAHTQWVAIQTPRSLLSSAGIDPDALRRVAVYSATRPANRSLAELLRRVVTPVRDSGRAPTGEVPGPGTLADELLDRIGLALSPGDNRSHTRRASLHKRAALVRRFERALSDAGLRAPRIPELAADLGVSQRTLEQIFREHLGISPKRFVVLMRLNEIYCDLLRSSPDNATVAELAQRHGIRQLGRFSAAYRVQFGELPSETLRRRR
jgi:AraC-like DNA-binding protein